MKFIKTLLLVSLFFLQKHTFAFSIKKEEIKNFKIISDLEKEKLKGRVKNKTVEITYYEDDGKIEKISFEKTSYNENGFKTMSISNHNILHSSNLVTNFEYDENNLLISSENKKEKTIHSYKFDEDGYLVESIKFFEKEMPLVENKGKFKKNYYDKAGLLIKKAVLYDGWIIANDMYTYDKNGNTLSITSDEKAFYNIENKYFPNSKEIEQKFSNFQGIEGTLLVFDKNAHIIEQKIIDLYRNKIDYHYTFKNKIDATGNLIEGLRYNNLLKYNDALTKITYEYY